MLVLKLIAFRYYQIRCRVEEPPKLVSAVECEMKEETASKWIYYPILPLNEKPREKPIIEKN